MLLRKNLSAHGQDCPVPKDQKNDTDVDIKKRNLLVVLINSNNQILCGDQFVDIKQLKERIKEFIDNPYNDEHKPERVEADVPFFGKMMVTKNHVISLQNDRGTEYQAYIDVQNEIAAAYNELRNKVSKEKFGKNFADLDEEQQKAVQTGRGWMPPAHPAAGAHSCNRRCSHLHCPARFRSRSDGHR